MAHKQYTTRRLQRKNVRKGVAVHKGMRAHTWVFLLLWLLFFTGALYVIFYTPVLHITNVQVSGTSRVSEDAVRDLVFLEMQGENIFGMARSHLWLTHSAQYRQSILALPEVRDVQIFKRFPQELHIDIGEYDTIPIICAYELDAEQCVIVDRNTGKIQESPVDFSSLQLVHNPIMRIILPQELPPEGVVLAPETLTHILTFAQNIAYAIDVQVADPYIAHTVGARDFYLTTADGWEIRVDFTQDTAAILTRLRILFNDPDFSARRSELEYIDTRFGERIFYKVRSVEKEQEIDNVEVAT